MIIPENSRCSSHRDLSQDRSTIQVRPKNGWRKSGNLRTRDEHQVPTPPWWNRRAKWPQSWRKESSYATLLVGCFKPKPRFIFWGVPTCPVLVSLFALSSSSCKPMAQHPRSWRSGHQLSWFFMWRSGNMEPVGCNLRCILKYVPNQGPTMQVFDHSMYFNVKKKIEKTFGSPTFAPIAHGDWTAPSTWCGSNAALRLLNVELKTPAEVASCQQFP